MKIKKMDLLCFFVLVPFFKPTYFSVIPLVDKIFQVIFGLSILFVVYMYIVKQIKPSRIVFFIALLQLWTLLVTISNGGVFSIAFRKFRYIVIITAICDLFTNRMATLFKCLMLHFELNIYTNLITVVLFKQGLYSRINDAYGVTTEWFLGARNNFIIWLFPGLIIAWLYREYFKKNTRCYLLTIVIVLTEIMQGSATALVGITLFIICILLPFAKKLFTPINSMIFASIAFLIIIVWRSFDFLEPIIVDVLGKTMTFSSRLGIWDNAILAISNRPITGYGILSTSNTISILGNMGTFIWEGATHTHAHILQILFQGGLIGFFIFLWIYYLDLKICAKLWKNRCAQICTFGIFAYTIMGITEVFEYSLMYLILILPFYLYKIVDQNNNNISKREYATKKIFIRI